ncbi:MAG: GNAT family N-acetyltransferase [Planctomycetes bacterium]|nr:GNAT family N-acetyltransferase [Planctomycetota bacterium]
MIKGYTFNYHDPDGMGEFEGDASLPSDKAFKELAEASGLYVTSDKHLHSYVIEDGSGALAGALYVSDDADFDVMVSPQHQGKGIGRDLLSEGISHAKEMREINPDAESEIRVLHPAVRQALFKSGYIVDRISGGNIDDAIMRPAEMTSEDTVKAINSLNIPNFHYFGAFLKAPTSLISIGEFNQAIIDVSAGKPVSKDAVRALTHFALSHSREKWQREFLVAKISQSNGITVRIPDDKSRLLEDFFSETPEKASAFFFDQAHLLKSSDDTDIGLFADSLKKQLYHFMRNGGVPGNEDTFRNVSHMVEDFPASDAEKNSMRENLAHNVYHPFNGEMKNTLPTPEEEPSDPTPEIKKSFKI